MKIIDTHCHPQFPQYDRDRDEVIRRALDSGIGMICVGTDLDTSRRAIELADRYEGLYASVGLHPNDNLNETYNQGSYIEIARHPKVVAIGEIGLDHYRTTASKDLEFQKVRFLQQIELATIVDKPVIIHCREAHGDMIEILKKSGSVKGVIHSFTGSVEDARSYIADGFYIGLNAIVTFSKEYEEMVRSIPLDRMLLETDSPYLAPAPYRGKRNEPAHVEIVGNLIAAILGEKPESVFGVTTRNARTLFGI